MKRALLALIWFYKKGVSPYLPMRCRFFPTCSEYAYIALQTHGVVRGLGYTLRRLLRCHPWGGSGIDLVPGTTCCSLEEKEI